MDEAYVERRSAPRIAVGERAHLGRPLALSVRLLDIGLGGVLLSASEPLDVGQCGRLSARLGEVAVEADIEIRRIAAGRDDRGGGYNLGARFVSLDEATERVMKQFLSAARG